MKTTTKRLNILTRVFVVITVFLFFIEIVPRLILRNHKAVFFKKGSVEQITLVAYGSKKMLNKKNDIWYIFSDQNPKETITNIGKVDTILSTIAAATKDDVVSTTDKDVLLFEVDGRRRIELIMKGGKTTILYIGKTDSVGGVFFRINKEKTTYRTNSNLESVFVSKEFNDLTR